MCNSYRRLRLRPPNVLEFRAHYPQEPNLVLATRLRLLHRPLPRGWSTGQAQFRNARQDRFLTVAAQNEVFACQPTLLSHAREQVVLWQRRLL